MLAKKPNGWRTVMDKRVNILQQLNQLTHLDVKYWINLKSWLKVMDEQSAFSKQLKRFAKK